MTVLTVPLTKPMARASSVRVRWPWLAAFVAFTQYALIGKWLIDEHDFVIGDAINRTVNAQVMVLSRDPHLGAMGFYWMPLPMLVRVPFVLLLAPFNQEILAGPLSCAAMVALVIPVLTAIGRELDLSGPLTATMVAIYAVNPTTLVYASNGMSEATFALTLALTLWAMVRFIKRGDVKSLGWLGVALAVGMMSRFEFLPLTVAAVIACMLIVGDRRLLRRTATLVALPSLFVFAIWSLASSLIKNDALFWYHAARSAGETPANHPWMPSDLTPFNIVRYCLWAIAVVSPLLLVASLGGLLQRGARKGLIGLLCIVGTLPCFVAFQLLIKSSFGTPRYFAMLGLSGVVIGMWVAAHTSVRSATVRHGTNVIAVGLMAVGAVVPAYVYRESFRAPIDGEWVLMSAITGKPVAPNHEIDAIRPMMAVLDPALATGARAVIDSEGATPLLLTRRPRSFIVPQDRDFEQIMSDPTDRFDYVVIMNVDFPVEATPAIREAMTRVTDGTFALVGTYGPAELYRFVPTDPAGNTP